MEEYSPLEIDAEVLENHCKSFRDNMDLGWLRQNYAKEVWLKRRRLASKWKGKRGRIHVNKVISLVIKFKKI